MENRVIDMTESDLRSMLREMRRQLLEELREELHISDDLPNTRACADFLGISTVTFIKRINMGIYGQDVNVVEAGKLTHYRSTKSRLKKYIR